MIDSGRCKRGGMQGRTVAVAVGDQNPAGVREANDVGQGRAAAPVLGVARDAGQGYLTLTPAVGDRCDAGLFTTKGFDQK